MKLKHKYIIIYLCFSFIIETQQLLHKIITKMQVSIQTDKIQKTPKSKPPPSPRVQQEQPQANYMSRVEEQEKQKKIKKLTQVNRELISKLKQQNEELTRKINKQKLKPGRSTSIKSSPKAQTNEIESTKKQLMNAYKQIDMYKTVLTNLKAKQISTDSIDKINQLENKIKYEDNVIEQLQKEIKYLGAIREQQEKELKVFQSEEIKNSVADLEKEIAIVKEKIKILKKNSMKRDDVEKKQHAYQIQLERILRKLNDEYYPGKEEKKPIQNDDIGETNEQEWQQAKAQLAQLRKIHQENGKKIDNIIRQRNKQLKSTQENQLKIKEKQRKLQTLKNKLTELTKLVLVRESNNLEKKAAIKQENSQAQAIFATQPESLIKPKDKEENEKVKNGRQSKKWMIPQGYCLQKGKILPDSIFFSDKTLLKDSKKVKIFRIVVWHNTTDMPCLLQFFYRNQKGQQIQGLQPVPNLANSLQQEVLEMSQGDYLHKFKGYFLDNEIVGVHFISKFGKEIIVKSQSATVKGELFSLQPRPNEIPSCVFGAYVRKSNEEVRMCHIGIEFIADW